MRKLGGVHLLLLLGILIRGGSLAPAIEAPVAVPVYETSFEVGTGSLPDGWEVAYGSAADIQWTTSVYRTGAKSVRLNDQSITAGLGLRCAKIRVEPSDHIGVSGYYKSTKSASVFIDYWDAQGNRMTDLKISFPVTSTSNNWTYFSQLAYVPAGATHATILLYSSSTATVDGYFDDVKLEWWPWESEGLPRGLMLDSFENGAGSLPDNWSLNYPPYATGFVTWDDTEAFSGDKSIHIADASTTLSAGLQCAGVAVTPGDVVEARAAFYAPQSDTAAVYLDFWDIAGTRMTPYIKIMNVSSDGEWEDFATTTTVPDGACSATLLLYSFSTATTDAYFDDVALLSHSFEAAPKAQTFYYNSFESGGSMPAGLPEGWTVPYGTASAFEWTDEAYRTSGQSIHIVDADSANHGIRSRAFGVTPGNTVDGRVWWFAPVACSASIYLEYWDGNGARMNTETRSFSGTSNNAWVHIGGQDEVPTGATSVTVLLYSSTTNQCDGYFDDVTLESLPSGGGSATMLFETSFHCRQDLDAGEWTVWNNEENIEWYADAYTSGSHCVKITDESATISEGVRSEHIDVTPGDDVWVKVWYCGDPGASVYFEFWNASNVRFATQSYGVQYTEGEWTLNTLAASVPANAVTCTILLYSSSTHVGTSYFDEVKFGSGFNPTHDRTPQALADVDHPAGPYKDADIDRALDNVASHSWAVSVKNSFKTWADRWKARAASDELLAYWIPRETPFRVVDCPVCGAGWDYAWTSIGYTHARCRNCATVFPNREFPEEGLEILTAPTGDLIPHTYYEDPVTHKKYRLSGLSRYFRTYGALIEMSDLGLYYKLTNDISYAQAAAKIMRRLAEVYPNWVAHDWYNVYPHYNNLQAGKVCGWKLYDCRVMIGVAICYDMIYDSGTLSDADKALIENFCFRELGEMLLPVAQRGCCINDGPYQMSAAAYMGVLLGSHELVKYAVEAPGGFLGFIQDYFFRDGHWEDASPSYESMALDYLYMLPEILQGYSDPAWYSGADRYDNMDVMGDPLLSKVHIAPLYNMFPDRTLPPINDGAKGVGYNKRHAEVQYNWAPTEKNLEILNWVYSGNIGGSGTEYSLFRRDPDADFTGVAQMCLSSATLVRPGLGWAILRQGEGDTRTDLVLDYGEPAGWHGHPDRLNFLLWFKGHEVVTDLGYLGARHPLRPWMAHGVCHNLVMVDGVDQLREPGKLILCASGDYVQAVVAEAPDAYAQCSRYERNMLLITPSAGVQYVADVFNVSGGDLHDYSFHGEGQEGNFSCAALASAVTYPGLIGPAAGGYDWFEDGRFTSATGEVVADWRLGTLYPSDPNDGVRLRMLDTSGNLINAKGPNLRTTTDPFAEPMLDYVIQRRSGPTNTFVSVVEPIDGGSPVITATAKLAVSESHGDPFDSVAMKVTHSAGTDYVIVTPNPARHVTVTDNGHTMELTGRLGVVSFDTQNALRFLWAADGETIVCNGYDLAIHPTTTGAITLFDDEADTFAIDTDLGDLPYSWRQYTSSNPVASWSTAQARTGHRSIRIHDQSASLSAGLQSRKIRINAGDALSLSGYYKGAGTGYAYLEYWNSAGTRIGTKSKSFSGSNWTLFTQTDTAPANTTHLTVLLYSGSTTTCDGYFDDVKVAGVLETSFEDGLAGRQIIAQGWNDGAYEMDRFTDNGTTTTIYLRDEPIITVEQGEAFRIPYWDLWVLQP